jgi:hypothetical protein
MLHGTIALVGIIAWALDFMDVLRPGATTRSMVMAKDISCGACLPLTIWGIASSLLGVLRLVSTTSSIMLMIRLMVVTLALPLLVLRSMPHSFSDLIMERKSNTINIIHL